VSEQRFKTRARPSKRNTDRELVVTGELQVNLGNNITGVNVAAAALITQFSIGCILSIAAFILRREQEAKPFWEEQLFDSLPWIVLAFTLFTTGLLFFSEPYSSLWKPLFGDVGVLSIRYSLALLLTFLVDVGAIFWLSSLTGGAYSPFTPVFFILPALAIFLREGFGHVVLYVVLICAFFTWGLFQETPPASRHRLAYWIVSIGSFVLATVVGYVTRPR